MKKSLLLTALLCTATSLTSFGQDFTPTNYNFSAITTEELHSMIRDDINTPAQANLGIDVINWQNATFSSDELKKGVILFAGAVWYNENNENSSADVQARKRADLKQGFSICNFGEKIGNVLVINGADSQLNENIKNMLGDDAPEDAPQIPRSLYNFGSGENLQLFFLLNGSSAAPIQVTMDLCAYNNNAENIQAIFNPLTPQLAGGGATHNQASGKETYGVSTFADFKNDKPEGTLNGFDWRRISFQASQAQQNAFTYLKATIPGASLNTGAILIKNITITKLASATTSPATPSKDEGTPTFKEVTAEDPEDISIYYDKTKMYVGESTPLYAMVNPLVSKESVKIETNIDNFGSIDNYTFKSEKSGEGIKYKASLNNIEKETEFNIYDHIRGIKIDNNQISDDIHLTVGESLSVKYELIADADANLVFDPETEITLKSTNNNNKVSYLDKTLSEAKIAHGQNRGEFDIAVMTGAGTNKGAGQTPVKISLAVKGTDTENSYTDEINLYHYGVSVALTMDYEKSYGTEHFTQNKELYDLMELNSWVQLKYNADASSAKLFPFVHNKALTNGLAPDHQDVSYQDYDIEVYTKKVIDTEFVRDDSKVSYADGVFTLDGIVSISKGTEKENGFYPLIITPLSQAYNDEVYVLIKSLTAGEANKVREPITTFSAVSENAVAPLAEIKYGPTKEYNVVLTASGLSGIEEVAVEDGAEAQPVYYTLQGVRVAQPTPGSLYIRHTGNKAEKVLFK